MTALALVQFIIYADATIVNVALPTIQRDLGFTSDTLVWVVNCYLLAAGGLLLLGGRLGDRFGHRRVFLLGAAGFAIASLIAGLAPNGAVLLVGRVVQGVSEGLAAPAGLALVALLFPDPGERGKAFGVWSGLSGLGAAAGVLLSGVFTDLLTWRLIFFLNVPLAIIALLTVPRLVAPDRAASTRQRLDWTGAVLITGGLFAVLYGILGVSTSGWASAQVLVPLAVGVAAMIGFLIVQMRVSEPLIPLRFVSNRVRATAYLVVIVLGGATAGLFFMVVLYLQDILGYTPLQSGLAWLPYTGAFLAGILLSIRLAPRWGARWTILTGLVLAGAGMFLLSLIGVDGSFLTDVLPATVLIGFGIGFANPAVQQAGMNGVSEKDAGLGSGLFTTLLQLSGAIGLSALISIALTTTHQATTAGPAATVAGYNAAFLVATIALVCAAVAALVLLPRTASTRDTPSEPAPQTADTAAGSARS
ncbi:MAG: MFS transporter [Actinobacteria bacterium]|nr:MFS transporter [Actinomycetota bacterium]